MSVGGGVEVASVRAQNGDFDAKVDLLGSAGSMIELSRGGSREMWE